MEASDFASNLGAVKEKLLRLRAKCASDVEAKKADLEKAEAQLVEIDAMLSASSTPAPAPAAPVKKTPPRQRSRKTSTAKTTKTTKTTKAASAKEESLIRIRRAVTDPDWEPVLEKVPGSFTRPTLYDRLGVNKSTADAAIKRWLDTGEIARVGEVRKPGSPRAQIVFAPVSGKAATDVTPKEDVPEKSEQNGKDSSAKRAKEIVTL